LCIGHAAASGDEAARAEQRARGQRGRARLDARASGRRRSTGSLRTTDDLLGALERALREVERSAGDRVARAKAVTAIVAEARATLKASELERENAELKRLLLERHPELRKHLRPVP
jgi:hypothetical protein